MNRQARIKNQTKPVTCARRSLLHDPAIMSRKKPVARFRTYRKIGQPLVADPGFAAKRPHSEDVRMSACDVRMSACDPGTRDTPQRRSAVDNSDRAQAC